jgi:hypothetical protein
MRKWIGTFTLSLIGLVAFSACASTQVAQLSTSLGLAAFENMGDINQRDVHLAVFVDDKLRNLNLTGEYHFTKFEFPAGEAFAVKLLKALSYNFRRITLLKSRGATHEPPPDAILDVSVQDAHLTFDITPKWATVDTSSFARLVVRAELKEPAGRIAWVGIARAQAEGGGQSRGMLLETDAARQIALGVERAIDSTIADLIKQMVQSPGMQESLNQWEKQRKL